MGRLKMGHLRGCCSGPDAAPGSRADANYWFRGAAQLWFLPDQQPLRLRRGAEPPNKKIQKVPEESERWGGDVGWEHGVGVKCWVHTWDKGLKLLVKLQFQQELDALDGGVAASQAGSLWHMPTPVKIDLLVRVRGI